MRLVGLLSFMVDHLQTAQGALASVLFLNGVEPAEELTEQMRSSIVWALLAQGAYHTMPDSVLEGSLILLSLNIALILSNTLTEGSFGTVKL